MPAPYKIKLILRFFLVLGSPWIFTRVVANCWGSDSPLRFCHPQTPSHFFRASVLLSFLLLLYLVARCAMGRFQKGMFLTYTATFEYRLPSSRCLVASASHHRRNKNEATTRTGGRTFVQATLPLVHMSRRTSVT